MELLGHAYAAHPLLAWIGLAAVLLAIELLTGSGWLLWPAASAAAVAVIVAVGGLAGAPAMALFAGLTIVTTILARRFMPRPFAPHGRDINDPVARVVGHHGRAVDAFRESEGRVFVDGKEWPAELASGEAPAAGQRVEVVGVRGVRLQVRAA